MILEDATFEAFGYFPSILKPKSNKPIIAACVLCGKFKITSKLHYYTFCISCSMKGKHLTEETKGKTSAALKGKHHTEETKGLMSKNHADFKGEKHPRWKGGKKLRKARVNAKHYRELGYTLLMPLAEGEEGHHVTNEYVIGIPKEVHQSMGGSMKTHRTKVLQWLKANDKKKYKIIFRVLDMKCLNSV